MVFLEAIGSGVKIFVLHWNQALKSTQTSAKQFPDRTIF